ncbi:hypothetical protein [Cytobacillus oceanisediminis]|uniref:hypothetical protein n=1 Tax=Cytobacillus oceanisediminis TaxID=665099 RepID=UPI00207AB7B5|nr:hypothetical protein [Cytobacillus oceanisediminis]USK42247.1 hypothetical protein LIT27_16545 [Cytobacillus oceanisediminis]
MKKSYLVILLVIMLSVVYLQTSIHTLAENNYLLPDNKEKQFISASEFKKSGKLTGYIQFKDADINFEQKLLYKDLKQYIKSKVSEYYFINLINIYSNPNSSVSPDRQIYFYCSISDDDNTLKYKYLILDAETSKPIAEGNGQNFKQESETLFN